MHIHICGYSHVYVYIQVFICICVFIYVYLYIHIYINMCIPLSILESLALIPVAIEEDQGRQTRLLADSLPRPPTGPKKSLGAATTVDGRHPALLQIIPSPPSTQIAGLKGPLRAPVAK